MAGVPNELRRLKVRVCRDADAAHRESLRAYGHTFCRPAPTICVSSAFFELPPGHRDAVLAHEIGHLLAGPRADEEDADRAFEAATGVRIQYRDGEHGRCLQWLPASDRRRLLGLFEFDFGGTRQDYEEPESDDVRFFAAAAGAKRELATLREAEAAAAEDHGADVWAQEGRRRLGWRPLVRNPDAHGDKPFTMICAWCKAHIGGPPLGQGHPKTSHGICRDCLASQLAEVEQDRDRSPPEKNPGYSETSLVPLDPATHLPVVPTELLPAHEWKPPRVTWDLLLSGRAPLVLVPEGATERPRITTALARLLTREGIADASRWLDLHAACGLAARLFVVDRAGERWEVMDVLLDRGGETGRLELTHLGAQGARTVGVHEGFGHMLPVVVYRPGRPRPRQVVKSEAEQIREEIAALWRDHDRCSVRHGQFEAARIVERIKGLEGRLAQIEGPRSNPSRSPDAWKTPPPCDVEGTGRPLTKSIAKKLEGEPVRVHLNLHNGCYVFTHGGLVTAYARFFHLKDVLPRVGIGGYKRCHELKVRNVHAYLEGTFVNSGEPPAKRGKGWRQITYNCKTNQRPCFYFVDNEECFEGAEEVRAWRVDNGDGTERCEVWVKGEPPERKKNPPECECTIPGGACACGAVDAECARVVACGPETRQNSDESLRSLERQVVNQLVLGSTETGLLERYLAQRARSGDTDLSSLLTKVGQYALTATHEARRGAQQGLKHLREVAGLPLLVDLDEMLRGYLECALWSSNDESDERGGEPLDKNYNVDDFAPEAVASAKADVELFALLCDSDMNAAPTDDRQRGYDLWLTRNRHGSGFWDRGYGEVGGQLTEVAQAMGEVDAYAGDDGKVCFFP